MALCLRMGLLEPYHARCGGLATGPLYAIARLQRLSSTVDPSSGFHVFLWAVRWRQNRGCPPGSRHSAEQPAQQCLGQQPASHHRLGHQSISSPLNGAALPTSSPPTTTSHLPLLPTSHSPPASSLHPSAGSRGIDTLSSALFPGRVLTLVLCVVLVSTSSGDVDCSLITSLAHPHRQ